MTSFKKFMDLNEIHRISCQVLKTIEFFWKFEKDENHIQTKPRDIPASAIIGINEAAAQTDRAVSAISGGLHYQNYINVNL